MLHSARVVLCLLSFLSGVSLIAADSPALKSAKALKGQQFVLRAHEDLFGSPKLSGWDGRLLYETKVSMANDRTQIGGDADWQGMYFVSGNIYELKDASVRDGALQLKLRQLIGLRTAPELKLDFDLYNDVRVSKNQRIASSIEGLLNDFRRISAATTSFPNEIAGVKFEWNVYHRNFLNDGKYLQDSDTRERMEMLVPREALKSFSDGNLSSFELVQKSILRENGVKVTLTSYDPIGDR